MTTTTTKMPAGRIDGPRSGRVFEAARPEPGRLEVLIEVRRAGICGTDLHIWKGDYGVARYPLIPGHEFSGVVAAIGEGVTDVQVGQAVTADPNIACHHCAACRRNEQNQCHNLEVLGVTRAGAFARYLVAPQEVVFSAEGLTFEQAALVEPLACVVWGLQRVRITPGDRVLIFGAGPMGCLMLQAVKRAGAAQVTVVDRAPARLALARRLGADVTLEASDLTAATADEIVPGGFDVVADATGVPAVIESAFAFARARGKVWIFGVAPETARASFSPYEVFRKDLQVIGSFALSKTFPEALALMRSGAIETAPLVSHTLPLTSFLEGLDLAENDPERMKIQFDLDG
jgi:2-desacetyl-2-hydroxyethyl bacteriochlorophyllide A dehydrogenase